MPEQIPHLRALRAFEAAARHLSFQDAAEELGLSPSAVSHQIRTLEFYLQTKLFERHAHSITLTNDGAELYPGLHSGFKQISESIRNVRATSAEGKITISAGPAIAAKFITPKLYLFEELWPALQIELLTSTETVDLKTKSVDVAIRYGGGQYEDLDSTLLLNEFHAPMCSPDLLSQEVNGLSNLEEVLNHPLLHDDAAQLAGNAPGWPDWFDMHDLEGKDSGRHFNQADHAIQAAIDGAGILMGRVAIAAPDLIAGRLVLPFEKKIRSPFSYYFVTRRDRMKEKHISVFREWLREQANLVQAELELD